MTRSETPVPIHLLTQDENFARSLHRNASPTTASLVEFLQYGDKVALFVTLQQRAPLMVSSIFPYTVQVPVGDEGPPLQFERCVFSFHPTDIKNPQSSLFGGDPAPKGELVYGDTIHIMHEYSERWLQRTRILSEERKNCFKLTLTSDSSNPDTCFKVMPSHKLRQVGEKVRPQDEVLLITEGDGWYISCQEEEVPFLEPSYLETTVAPYPCTWSLELCDETPRDGGGGVEDCIRILDAVVLYHKEAEAFLTAPALGFDYQSGERLVVVTPAGPTPPSQPESGPHFLPAAAPRTAHPSRMSVSSKSLWMIEHPERNKVGNVVPMNPYLLKHISSERYIKIETTDTGAVRFILCPLPDVDNGLFHFVPVDPRHSTAIRSKHFFRIRHSSGVWLHAVLPSTRGVKVAARQAIPMVVSERAVYGDAMLISQPLVNPKRLLDKIRPQVRQLHYCIAAFYRGAPAYPSWDMSENIKETSTALTNLITMCSDVDQQQEATSRVGMPLLENQQALMDEDVHLVVLNLVKAPFSPPPWKQEGRPTVNILDIGKEENLEVQLLCALCYRLLKQMVRGSPDLALRLAPYVPFMLDQLGHRFHVADTLMELFFDNPHMEHLITDHILTMFVKRAEEHNNQIRYAKFLAGVTICQEKSVMRVQDTVCKMVLIDSPHLIVPLRLENNALEVQLTMDVPEDWLHRRMDDRPNGYMKGEWIDLATYCQVMPYSVSGNLEVLLQLYAGVAQNNSNTKEVVEKLVPPDLLKAALSSASGKSLPERWRGHFFEIVRSVYCIEHTFSDLNTMLWSDLLDKPAKGHTVTVPSFVVSDVLPEALKFLSTNTSLSASQKESNQVLRSVLRLLQRMVTGGLLETTTTKTLLELLLQMDGSQDCKTLSVTPRWGSSNEPIWDRYSVTEENLPMMQCKREVCGVLTAILNREVHTILCRLLLDFKTRADIEYCTPELAVNTLTLLQEYVENNILHNVKKPELSLVKPRKLTSLLLAYTHYKMDSLVSDALSLLVRFNSLQAVICGKLQDLVIFHEPYQEVEGQVLQFGRLVHLYGTYSSLTHPQILTAVEIMRKLSKWMQAVPEEMGHMPFAKGKKGKTRNLVLHYQNFMRNAGLHRMVAELMGHHRPPPLVNAACKLLMLFCVSNKRNQQVVFESMEQNFDWMSVSQYEDTIVEIFRNNYALCTKISPELVDKATNAIVSEDTDLTACLNIVNFLKQIVIVGRIPIVTNQTRVMQSILGRKSPLLHQLATINASMPPNVLQRATAVAELMHLCTLGFNPTTESLARGLVPITHILRILAEQANPLPLDLQVPYIHLLIEVFFFADDGLDGKWWMENDQWWAAVERMMYVLQDSLDNFNTCQDIPPPLEPGRAEYIFSGVVPCLSSFLTKCRLPPSGRRSGGGGATRVLQLLRDACDVVSALVDVCGQLSRPHCEAVVRFFNNIPEIGLDVSRQMSRCERVLSVSQESTVNPRYFIDIQLDQLQNISEDQRLNLDHPQEFAALVAPFLLGSESKQTLHNGVIKNIAQRMQANRLPEWVTLVMLQVFTSLINQHIEDKSRLRVEQCFFQQMGAVPLMPCLLEEGSRVVVAAAVDYGIALLHGGNKVVQDCLLEFFMQLDEIFFEDVAVRLQKAARLVRQYKQEQAFLKTLFAEKFYTLTEEQARRHQQISDPHSELAEIQKLLRLLQLFCEGHHLGFQNFVREQPGHRRTFNVVTDVAVFLSELVNMAMNDTSMQTCIQVLTTLTEFCQGPCQLNQKALVMANICGDVNQIFSRKFEGCDPELIDSLRTTATVTLCSLLEGCHSATLPSLMVRELSIEAMRSALTHYVAVYRTRQDSLDEEEREGVFMLFILVYMLEHWTKDEQLRKLLDDIPGIKVFHQMLGTIEISRDGVGEMVYFCLPSLSHKLTKKKRRNLLNMVNLSSTAKLSDFYHRATNLITEIEFEADAADTTEAFLSNIPLMLPRTRKFLADLVSLRGVLVFDTVMIFMAFGLNGVMLMVDRTTEPGPKVAYSVLAIIQVLASLAIFCLVLFVDLPLVLHRELQDPLPTKGVPISILHVLRVMWSLPIKIVLRYLYYPIMLIFSILGIKYPFFFALQLLGVIRHSRNLQNAAAALTGNMKSLIVTAFLTATVVYLFSYAAYLMSFYDKQNDNAGILCNDATQCFIWTLSNGLRAGGGVGDVLPKVEWSDKNHRARIAFDLMFFVCVNIGLINMMFGIIIDAFAELRDERKSREENQRSHCFICGIEADTFNRARPFGFEEHVHKSHSMWGYLHFIHHLKRKRVEEYTGQESYVYNLILQNSIAFFPVGTASDLVNLPNRAAIEQKPDNNQFVIDVLLKRLQSFQDNFTKLENEMRQMKNMFDRHHAATPPAPSSPRPTLAQVETLDSPRARSRRTPTLFRRSTLRAPENTQSPRDDFSDWDHTAYEQAGGRRSPPQSPTSGDDSDYCRRQLIIQKARSPTPEPRSPTPDTNRRSPTPEVKIPILPLRSTSPDNRLQVPPSPEYALPQQPEPTQLKSYKPQQDPTPQSSGSQYSIRERENSEVEYSPLSGSFSKKSNPTRNSAPPLPSLPSSVPVSNSSKDLSDYEGKTTDGSPRPVQELLNTYSDTGTEIFRCTSDPLPRSTLRNRKRQTGSKSLHSDGAMSSPDSPSYHMTVTPANMLQLPTSMLPRNKGHSPRDMSPSSASPRVRQSSPRTNHRAKILQVSSQMDVISRKLTAPKQRKSATATANQQGDSVSPRVTPPRASPYDSDRRETSSAPFVIEGRTRTHALNSDAIISSF